MKNPNQTWSEYLNNRNVRPKLFRTTVVRNADGTFEIVGGNTRMLNVINQYDAEWVPVDARDFATALNQSKVTAR